MKRSTCIPASLLFLMIPTLGVAQIPTPIPSLSVQKSRSVELASFLFPVTNQDSAKKFWARDELTFLSSGTLLFEDKAFGANIELLSDIIGLFRVGIGVTAAGASDDEGTDDPQTNDPEEPSEEAALARLAASGGILRVTAALPLFYRAAEPYNSTWAVMLNLSGGTESPKTGGVLENPALAFNSSIELFYQREGLDGEINFQFGMTALHARFNDEYSEKAGIEKSHGTLIVPRIGLVLIGKTRIDLLYRGVRSDAFDSLGKFAVTLQQVVS